MMVMQETAVRPLLAQMQEQAAVQLVELEGLEERTQANFDAIEGRISKLREELRGFASLLGRGPDSLIAEFKDRPGWSQIPTAEIPMRFRARQNRADRELYDACRERDAALLILQRAREETQVMRELVDEFELLMTRSDDILVAFLRRRGWQIRELMRKSAEKE